MAAAETQRIAEIKAKLSQLSQAFSVPESVGLGALNVYIVNGAPEMVLNPDTGQSQPYGEWLALQSDLASLEKLLAAIEEKGINLDGERVDIPMRVPSGPAPEVTAPAGEEQVDVPLGVPDMRRDLVQATFREAEKELQQVIADTKTVPESLEVFTKLNGDARVAVEQMFKDPFKTGNNDERATPIYRGYKQPDGSVTRGQLIVQYPPQSLEAVLGGMKPETVTALGAEVNALVADKDNVPDALPGKIKMLAEQGTPEEKKALKDIFQRHGAKLNLEGAEITAQREEPFEYYVQKQPDGVVAPVAQQLGGGVASQKQAGEKDAAAGADAAAEREKAEAEKEKLEQAAAVNNEAVKLHDFTDIYDDTLKLGRKRGMHSMGLGVGIATVGVLAVLGMPAFGIGLFAIGSTLAGRYIGEGLGARAAEDQALENVIMAMTVDLAKLSPEKREEILNDELSRFGNRKCSGALRARVQEMLEAADKLPKDKDALSEIDRQVMAQIDHSRREAPVDPEHAKWVKYGTLGTLAVTTLAVAAPALAPLVLLGATPEILSLVAAPVVGTLTAATLGHSAGAFVGTMATERGAESKLAKGSAESLSELDPQKRQQVLDGLSHIFPDSSMKKIEQALDDKIPERRNTSSASATVESPIIASPLVANQRVVEEYAHNVAGENAALGSAIKSFATGRTQLQDIDDVARHIVKSAEKGEPVPGEVVEAISKLAHHANNLGAVEAIMRAKEQALTATGGRGAA